MFHDADGDSWCQGFREQCYPSKVSLMFQILSIYQNGVPNNIDPPCPKFIFQGSTTEWMRHDETSWISWVWADTESDLNEGPPVPSGVHALPSGEILGVEQQKCPDCTGLMTYSFCSFGVRRSRKTNSNSNTQIVFFCFADTAYIQDYTRLQDVTKSIGAPVLCRTPCAKHNQDQLLRKKQWQPLRSDTPCGCFCFFRFAARMTANESCASNGVCHSKLIIQVAARSKAAIYQPECAGFLLKTLL